MISGETSEVQELKSLNRMVRWTNWGIEFATGPRHAEIVVRQVGREGATPSKAPGVKADGDTEKVMPTENKKKKSSGGQTSIDNGAARTTRQNRQNMFGKCILEGIRPDEAKA